MKDKNKQNKNELMNEQNTKKDYVKEKEFQIHER